MVAYRKAIEWIAEHWDTDALYRREELDPNADVIRMICDLYGKTVRQVDVDLQKEIWELDNLNRGNG